MNSRTFRWPLGAIALAALVAACGGGDDSTTTADATPTTPAPAPATPTTALQITGVAATGAPLAGATVDVKCAAGTPTASTTGANGAYTVTVSGGTLPCIVRVSGTSASGTPVTLHSLADAGGTANVTPLTEMIVAQLAKASPAELYAAFTGTGVTSAALAQATSSVTGALKTATGIDVTAIDPFKGTLVPAQNGTPGNAYDQALDALNAKVPTAGLPIVVAQIANASSSGSGTALAETMQAVNLGSLENCPTAVSGKYRVLAYTGRTDVVSFDFKARQMSGFADDGTPVSLALAPSTTQACQFTVGSNTFYMGPTGVGAMKGFDTLAYVFPVQAHGFAAVQGEWSFLESGIDEADVGVHNAGRITVNADKSASICEYDATLANCVAEADKPVIEEHAADGGFLMTAPGELDVTQVWGYKAPNGSFTLFGTGNGGGATGTGVYRTHFVATKLKPLPLPEVGSETRFWNLTMNYVPTAPQQPQELSTNVATVTAVDAAAGSITRTFNTGASDTLLVNKPIDGTRIRTTGSPVIQVPLPGLGVTAIIDNSPTVHSFGLAVSRP